MKIAVFVGSLQKDSHNKKLAKTLEGLMPEEVTFEYVDLNLPLFNQDLEAAVTLYVDLVKKLLASDSSK